MDTALCISLQPQDMTSKTPEDVAELDGEDVLDAVVGALGSLGTVRVWDMTSMAPSEVVAQQKPDLIFNLAEGTYGAAREAQAPALFEWLQWPYAGSDPLALAITLDKWYTKCVLQAAQIPTPRGRIACQPIQEGFPDLTFPLLVKPVGEGTAIGISDSSVVGSEQEICRVVNTTLEAYGQPALIEEFLDGREFTVALIGNAGKWEVLPIVEINFEGMIPGQYPIFSFPRKKRYLPNRLFCPALVDEELQTALTKTAVATCDALRIRDWARVDIRIDRDGTPAVLEVNPLPGLKPCDGPIHFPFTRAANVAGLDYEAMIHKIVHAAIDRLGLTI